MENSIIFVLIYKDYWNLHKHLNQTLNTGILKIKAKIIYLDYKRCFKSF